MCLLFKNIINAEFGKLKVTSVMFQAVLDVKHLVDIYVKSEFFFFLRVLCSVILSPVVFVCTVSLDVTV